MRARNIKPGLWKDEELAALPIEARYLFPGLWCLADCLGRLEDRPRWIKSEIYPYDDAIGAAKIHHLLQLLHDGEFIQRYEIDGKFYIQIINFERHQNPHKQERAKGSQIPAPQQVESVRKKTEVVPIKTEAIPVDNGSTRDDYGLRITDSLIPDCGNTIPAVCAPKLAVVEPAPVPSYRFDEVWSRWPRKTGHDSAARDWLSAVTVANEAAVLACVERYLASDEVSRGAVRNLGSVSSGGTLKSGWLIDCAKDNWNCDWPKARDSPQPRKVDHVLAALAKRQQEIEIDRQRSGGN